MRKIIRSEMSYSEPVSFDLEVYTMLKREDLDYLEKEITERDARVSELENKLKKYRSDEIEKEVEKLENQNAIMKECLEFEYRISAFFDNNQMLLSQHHRIGKALGEIKELEGEE